MTCDPELILERAAEQLTNGEHKSALRSFEFLKQEYREYQPDWHWDLMIGRCLVALWKEAEAVPHLTSAYKEIDEDADPVLVASIFIDLTIAHFVLGNFEEGHKFATEGQPYVMRLDSGFYHHDRYLFFLNFGRICLYLDDFKNAARLFSLALSDKLAINQEEEAARISMLHLELFRAYSYDGDWENAKKCKNRIQYDLLKHEDKRDWHLVMMYYLWHHHRPNEVLHIFEQFEKIGIDEGYLGEVLYLAAYAHRELGHPTIAKKLFTEALAQKTLSSGYRESAEGFLLELGRGDLLS